MRVEYINPFIQAATDVIKELLKEDTRRGDLSLKAAMFACQQVSVVLGLVGEEVKGQVIYGLTEESALKIATRMMGGIPMTEMDELTRSAIGELGNMITGRASGILERTGVAVEISPPTLIIGSDFQVASSRARMLSVPIIFDGITLEINVGLD